MIAFAVLTGLGFGLFCGYYIGQRGGLSFVQKQLDMASHTAEKMAQVIVAPYGNRQVEQVDQMTEEMFNDVNSDDERTPSWMEDEDERIPG